MNLKLILLLVIVIIGLAAYFVWQTQSNSAATNRKEHMHTTTSKDGTQIAYTQSGTGPVVILVGGALQSKSDQLMGSLTPLLAKDFTVVSYDRRGRGDSADNTPYAVEREIEDLESIINDAGGTAYVFGNSSGGNLALWAATKLKNISKVAVYEVPFIPEAQLNSSGAAYVADLKKAIAVHQNGKAVKLFMKRIGVPAPMVAMMSITPMWSGLKTLAPTLVYDGLIVGDGSVPKQLSSMAVPVLFITGTDERMQNAAKAAVEVLPIARHEVLEGQSHSVKPDVLAPALIKFFK